MIIPSLEFEQNAWQRGFNVVIGVDEVGRGAWAGPVVAAAVQLPKLSIRLDGLPVGSDTIQFPKLLRDSKKLSEKQRKLLNKEINYFASQVSVGIATVDEINELGIVSANFLAMRRAWEQLDERAEFLLIDGFSHPDFKPNCQISVVKGDAKVASIAAASIVAKVYRDSLMVELSAQYPQYGLERHKGYGTAIHLAAIQSHGFSPIHRRNFAIKALAT